MGIFDRTWRLAVFRSMVPQNLTIEQVLRDEAEEPGSTVALKDVDLFTSKNLNQSLANTIFRSYRPMLFDWALALNLDSLPAENIAVNVMMHARSVVAAASEKWLDTFGSKLRERSFERDHTVEGHLPLFAGTTCCAQHRSLRVYTSRALASKCDKGLISSWLPKMDPWTTEPFDSSGHARALWLQAARAQQLKLPMSTDFLVRLLRDIDWGELQSSDLSIFDVPLQVEGPVNKACEMFCCCKVPTAAQARALQASAIQGDAACIFGCVHGIRRARRHTRPAVQFLANGSRRFRYNAAGLYAYKVMGAML